MTDLPPLAHFGTRLATGLRDVTRDLSALDSAGFWAVAVDFDGDALCARFDRVRESAPPPAPWPGVPEDDWHTSLDGDAYRDGVRRIREHIAAGDVYQVNLCRLLTAPLPPGPADLTGLAALLAAGNPAPYAGLIRLPEHGVHIACASPELYLSRNGDNVSSGPIKGTGHTEADLLPKDYAENVMIVDLVRNDLNHACRPGSVTVPELCVVEKHPGLVHLVSQVDGVLSEGAGWAGLFAGTFPPGSVSGAPKSSALRIIKELETVPRGPYCGAVGWVDADRGQAELAVGIRSFFVRDGELCFGTGAGITYDSDPQGEWEETQLKARNLLAVAARTSGAPA